MKLFAAVAALLSLWIVFAQVENRDTVARVGDHGLATKAAINDPQAIALDGSQALYIAENTNVIRRVDLKSGIITTIHTKPKLEAIISLVVDTTGHLIAAEFTVDRVSRIDPISGSVTTVAGGRRLAFSGDGGPAIHAGLNRPEFVTTDASDNVYIADMGNSRIRRVDAKTGIITTVAGSGKRDSSGDGSCTRRRTGLSKQRRCGSWWQSFYCAIWIRDGQLSDSSCRREDRGHHDSSGFGESRIDRRRWTGAFSGAERPIRCVVRPNRGPLRR